MSESTIVSNQQSYTSNCWNFICKNKKPILMTTAAITVAAAVAFFVSSQNRIQAHLQQEIDNLDSTDFGKGKTLERIYEQHFPALQRSCDLPLTSPRLEADSRVYKMPDLGHNDSSLKSHQEAIATFKSKLTDFYLNHTTWYDWVKAKGYHLSIKCENETYKLTAQICQ